MIFRKLFVILCLSSTLLLISCSGEELTQHNQTNNSVQETDNQVYQINSSSYSENATKIFYPQLSDMRDTAKQEKINDLIKKEILKTLDLYDNKNNLSMDIHYNIMLDNSKILSILYSGIVHPNKTAYPLNVLYTTNIDLSTAEKIRLSDFIEINDELSKKLKEAKYVAWDSELNSAEELIRKDISNYKLTEVLKNSDDLSEKNSGNVFSYFTNNALGISLGVTHAIGDHAEFEIDYAEIKDLLKDNYK